MLDVRNKSSKEIVAAVFRINSVIKRNSPCSSEFDLSTLMQGGQIRMANASG